MDSTAAPAGQESYSLVELKNGVRTIRCLQSAETFHPVIGPGAEADALYVRQLKLRERLQAKEGSGPFVIWDVGLGGGANVLTALRACRDLSSPVQVISFDRTIQALEFGLRQADHLDYFHGYEPAVEEFLRQGEASFENGKQPVHWRLHLGNFPRLLEQEGAGWPAPSAIFYDPFSPARNPEMYTLPLFKRLFTRIAPTTPCTLANYSRSTFFRVTLLVAGFFVGHGEATGEKEETTLAANRLDLIGTPLGCDWLERARRSTSAEPLEDRYGQQPLSPATWEALQRHPQFSSPPSTLA